MKRTAFLSTWAILFWLPTWCLAAEQPVKIQRDDQKGQLQVLIDGREAVVYQYGSDVDMPHYYPVRSPSGQLLTVEQTEPYPHHRSVWFADTVQLAGHENASFYIGLYSTDEKKPEAGFREHIRHVKFLGEETADNKATVKAQLLWEADYGQPARARRGSRASGRVAGQGRVSARFDLRAQGFLRRRDISQRRHPLRLALVRMHNQFSVDKGGTITNSEGRTQRKGNAQSAGPWVDYSCTVDGVTEGLALLAPDKEPPRFFTRDYGTFGPRRPDAQSGKPFTLKKGESLKQRTGILVHSGDAGTGRVQERYQQYIDGKL